MSGFKYDDLQMQGFSDKISVLESQITLLQEELAVAKADGIIDQFINKAVSTVNENGNTAYGIINLIERENNNTYKVIFKEFFVVEGNGDTVIYKYIKNMWCAIPAAMFNRAQAINILPQDYYNQKRDEFKQCYNNQMDSNK